MDGDLWLGPNGNFDDFYMFLPRQTKIAEANITIGTFSLTHRLETCDDSEEAGEEGTGFSSCSLRSPARTQKILKLQLVRSKVLTLPHAVKRELSRVGGRAQLLASPA